MTRLSFIVCIALLLVQAHASNPHGWSPSVSTASQLDAPDGNGFCLDVTGFGNNINCQSMQAHSCKPQGADTQYSYDATLQRLQAVNLQSDCTATDSSAADPQGGCVTVQGEVVEGAQLGLADCEDDPEDGQTFAYVASSTGGMLQMESSNGDMLCLGVGDELRAAGSFWARDLMMRSCATTDALFLTWAIDPMIEATTAVSYTHLTLPTKA